MKIKRKSARSTLCISSKYTHDWHPQSRRMDFWKQNTQFKPPDCSSGGLALSQLQRYLQELARICKAGFSSDMLSEAAKREHTKLPLNTALLKKMIRKLHMSRHCSFNRCTSSFDETLSVIFSVCEVDRICWRKTWKNSKSIHILALQNAKM